MLFQTLVNFKVESKTAAGDKISDIFLFSVSI